MTTPETIKTPDDEQTRRSSHCYPIDPGDWESATGECLPKGQDCVVVRKVEAGPYESEGHKDRCALIGLLVSRTLDMRDESPRDIEACVDAMALGLRIIATWASCDSGSRETRIEAMEAINRRAMESLGKPVG